MSVTHPKQKRIVILRLSLLHFPVKLPYMYIVPRLVIIRTRPNSQWLFSFGKESGEISNENVALYPRASFVLLLSPLTIPSPPVNVLLYLSTQLDLIIFGEIQILISLLFSCRIRPFFLFLSGDLGMIVLALVKC